jgi:hypothetical protein
MSSPDQVEGRPIPSRVSPKPAAWIGVWIASGAFALGWVLAIERFGWIGGLLGWWPASIAAAVAGAAVTIALTRLANLSTVFAQSRAARRRLRPPGEGPSADSIVERSIATATSGCETSSPG